MLQVRLDTLRLAAQRRVDREVDPSVAIPEWNALLSETYGELYSAVEQTGVRMTESVFSIAAAGSATFTLPSNHLSTVALFRITDSAGTRRELSEIMPQERSRWAGQVGDALVYDIVGSAITLYPTPSTGSYELIYIPQATDLSQAADSTLIDVFSGNGQSFMIWAAAIKSSPKGEFDIQLALTERDKALEATVDWAIKRAFTQPWRRINREVPGYYDMYGRDSVNDPGGWWDRH